MRQIAGRFDARPAGDPACVPELAKGVNGGLSRGHEGRGGRAGVLPRPSLHPGTEGRSAGTVAALGLQDDIAHRTMRARPERSVGSAGSDRSCQLLRTAPEGDTHHRPIRLKSRSADRPVGTSVAAPRVRRSGGSTVLLHSLDHGGREVADLPVLPHRGRDEHRERLIGRAAMLRHEHALCLIDHRAAGQGGPQVRDLEMTGRKSRRQVQNLRGTVEHPGLHAWSCVIRCLSSGDGLPSRSNHDPRASFGQTVAAGTEMHAERHQLRGTKVLPEPPARSCRFRSVVSAARRVLGKGGSAGGRGSRSRRMATIVATSRTRGSRAMRAPSTEPGGTRSWWTDEVADRGGQRGRVVGSPSYQSMPFPGSVTALCSAYLARFLRHRADDAAVPRYLARAEANTVARYMAHTPTNFRPARVSTSPPRSRTCSQLLQIR